MSEFVLGLLVVSLVDVLGSLIFCDMVGVERSESGGSGGGREEGGEASIQIYYMEEK